VTRKRALIIGASSGIGEATAVALADLGWSVTAIARRMERLRNLSNGRDNIEVREVDVSDVNALEKVISDCNPIDAIVYAAGWNLSERELNVLDPLDWYTSMSINIDGAFHATRFVLPQMRGRGGVIVYVSSISATEPDGSGAAYQASKRALHGLAHAVTIEESQHGVRASLVLPGLTATELNYKRRVPPSDDERALFLTPEDVAATIVHICTLPPRVMITELTIVPTAAARNR